MKSLKIFGIVMFVCSLIFSCQSTGIDKTPPPITKSGDHVWKSDKIEDCKITIDGSFMYMGELEVRGKNAIKTYYAWDRNFGNDVLYVFELEFDNWSYPKDRDPLEPDTNKKGLLKYKPNEYVIWTGVNQLSYDTLMEMGIDLPKNKVVLVKMACINKNRDKAVFIVYSKIWDSNHTDFENILKFYDEVVK